jgi:hypothetical protein
MSRKIVVTPKHGARIEVDAKPVKRPLRDMSDEGHEQLRAQLIARGTITPETKAEFDERFGQRPALTPQAVAILKARLIRHGFITPAPPAVARPYGINIHKGTRHE